MRTKPASSSSLLPLLPLRSLTLLPGIAQPVELGRPDSVAAVQAARNDRGPFRHRILVAPQRDPVVDQPTIDDLYPVAVLAELTQALEGAPGRMTAILRGLHRVRVTEVVREGKVLYGHYGHAHDVMSDPTLAHALAGALQDLIKQHDSLLPTSAKHRTRAQALAIIMAERSPSLVCDLSAAHAELELHELIEVLLELSVAERLRKVIEKISQRIHVLRVKRELDDHVREHLSQHEHEAVLRHKMRAIQGELGSPEPDEEWLHILRDKLERLPLGEEARTQVERELGRLERMNPQGTEASIVRSYLELIADLPWGPAPRDTLDLAKAKTLLEDGHHGLEKVKRRIIEYLSVRKLAPERRGPIVCFSGPPGVGKTSLAKSIAEALGRPFVRASLGGVKDEAEIRGHRRTYVGSLPGRVISGMKRAKACNPVFLLDEIDKLTGSDMRGDPAAALLEALDPEQNATFEDHYLNLPYDLSKVLFICTANDSSKIPEALRDRLEMIELSGYSNDDKLAIARKHLLPRALQDNGLRRDQLTLDDDALTLLATGYTRESGVRNLGREIDGLVRHVAMKIVEDSGHTRHVTAAEVPEILGPVRFLDDERVEGSPVGVATGLGWTPQGGRLLLIEVYVTRGDGQIRLTGRLGEVMKESGQTALSLVRSRAASLGIDPLFLERHDLHVHLPQGAVPKDGPSAGVGLTTAIVSALTHRGVRGDTALTGEITLRGHVLPVGGIREKVLAAHRAGLRRVLLPLLNQKDEVDIPVAVRNTIEIKYVEHIDEVLQLMLLARPEPAAVA